MDSIALDRWLSNSENFTIWSSSLQTRNALEEWNKMILWWRDARALWHQTKWYPKPSNVFMLALRRVDVWNSCIIFATSKSDAPLHRSANQNQTKKWCEVYRTLRFLNFGNFLKSGGTMMFGSALDVIIEKLTRRSMTIDYVTQKLYSALTRNITKTWLFANEQRLSTHKDESENAESTEWKWQQERISDFKWTTTNSMRKPIERNGKISRISASIRVDINRVINTAWKAEPHTHAWLSPSRKDLLMWLQQNGLLLGSKRLNWGDEYQLACVPARTNIPKLPSFFLQISVCQGIMSYLLVSVETERGECTYIDEHRPQNRDAHSQVHTVKKWTDTHMGVCHVCRIIGEELPHFQPKQTGEDTHGERKPSCGSYTGAYWERDKKKSMMT